MNEDQFSFAGLGPDVILDAIESYGVYVSSGLLALNSYENRVYQFIAEDGQRYVAKFYRPMRWSSAQIQEEHNFSIELAAHDIPVVAPLRFDGQTLLEYQQWQFALFPSVGGRQFENDNLEQLEWMGRFIGRLHKVGGAQSFVFREQISLAEYVDQPLALLQATSAVPTHLQESFFTIAERVALLCHEQYRPLSTLRLHGDCHPGNILWRDGPSFVDLDDARSGPPIQDLWMMLSGERADKTLQLDVLVEAYSEYAELDSQQFALIEPLRAMRMIHHLGWIQRRWKDPAFPRAFPWFASDKFWEQQILSLKEQFAVLQEPPLSFFP